MALRQDAQRNRERILAGARDVFASGGVDAPVEEITRRAGVGMGTLYRHFPTKDDLVDAVLEEALDAYVSLARAALADEDAWAGLAGFLRGGLALHAANRCLIEVTMTSEHGRARAQSTRELVRPLLDELVARAHAQGTLRADVGVDDIPPLFWGIGRIIERTEAETPGYWRRHLGYLLDGLASTN